MKYAIAVPDVEDIEGIDSWFIEGLKSMGSKYPIKVISITTHGATGVCIDKYGGGITTSIFSVFRSVGLLFGYFRIY